MGKIPLVKTPVKGYYKRCSFCEVQAPRNEDEPNSARAKAATVGIEIMCRDPVWTEQDESFFLG